jgi:NADPH2:quinone reductase
MGLSNQICIVAVMPTQGAYSEFVCLPESGLVPVPSSVDPAEVISLLWNYITAYQVLHRAANVKPRRRFG